MVQTLKRIVDSTWFQRFILGSILAAGLLVGIQTYEATSPTIRELIPTLDLFDKLILARTATADSIWAWSLWRRKHQATARYHHYQRRSERQ